MIRCYFFYSEKTLYIENKILTNKNIKEMKKTRRKRAFQHNIDAANAVINELRVNQKALAIQSTGTGKSYVMREIIEKFPLKNVMVVGPSWKVLTEVRGILDTRKTNCTIEYATYIGLAKRIVNSLPTGLDAIIIDEVHHLPAPVWGRGVKELENVNSQAKLIGFTGTPKRTDGIDISQSHFNGETTKMDYVEAWEKGILPTPKFVNVYFKVDENPINVAKSYLKKKGISDTNRVEAEKAAKVLELEWDRIKETQSKIIKQHLRKTAQKIIVFFDNISDLEKFSGEVESWFRVAGFNPTSISIHSKLLKSIHDHNWEQALLPSKNGELKLIMSVSMLNEGVHIPEVEGVMFLRRTVSSIIYLQQLGRCMKARQKQQPVVFDFVGNIESAGETISTTFNKNIVTKVGNKKNQRPSFKLKVYEYGKNIIDILSKIKRLTFGNDIPKKLLKAHETGDYSEIKWTTSEYTWMRNHKSGGKGVYFSIADIIWKEYQNWKRRIIVPPKLQKAYRNGDYSEIKYSSHEYNWMLAHRKGNTKKCFYYSIADTIWNEYQKWRSKVIVPPKLLRAHETGDYSEINSRTPEYVWMHNHKDGGCNSQIPIASTMWNEYQEQKELSSRVSKFQKILETGDFSKIKPGTSEYNWLLGHRKGGSLSHYKIADIIWNKYQKLLKEKRKPSVPSKLQKAYRTGDYSEIKWNTPEYNWLRSHGRKESQCHAYYPIAGNIWKEYQKWREKDGVNVPRRLLEAHKTGNYSKIYSGSAEYRWLITHRGNGKFGCVNYPIADIMWNEYQEWRKKNKK